MTISCPIHIEGKKEAKVKCVNDSIIERAISALEEAKCNIVRYHKLLALAQIDSGGQSEIV